MTKATKKSPVDKAFSALRAGDNGRKADAVLVCRLYMQEEDGSWETDGAFRHWIKGLPPDQKNALPAGVPGAVIAFVSAKPLQKHVGKLLKSAAAAVLTPHLGENTAAILGDIIQNFTKEE